ncbi:MAG TPA: hypothetical protein VEL74_07285 [Thermoanaerobaculia bacterium]|nr:hypothetical protein [Thermoanaerobaculia bacterium]
MSWWSASTSIRPLPEWRRWSVVRIVEDRDPSSATGVTFLEV